MCTKLEHEGCVVDSADLCLMCVWISRRKFLLSDLLLLQNTPGNCFCDSYRAITGNQTPNLKQRQQNSFICNNRRLQFRIQMIVWESPKCDSSLVQIKAQKVSQVQQGESTKKFLGDWFSKSPLFICFVFQSFLSWAFSLNKNVLFPNAK